MKFTRRTGMAALAAAPLLAALPACNRGGGEGGGEDLDIALVSKGFQHQFWQAVQQGADEAAEEHGVSITFDGPAAETEVDAQLQMFQAAIDRGPDAICYASLDPEACVPLRSEEHTSELQSRGHLVCRLLHEKKNKHDSNKN